MQGLRAVDSPSLERAMLYDYAPGAGPPSKVRYNHSPTPLEKALTEGSPSQSVKSAQTSIKQQPAMFKKIKWNKGTINADIGGGKHDVGTEWLKKQGVTNYVIDPFNRSVEHNKAALAAVRGGQADTATVANVLNVIPEKEVRAQTIRSAADAIKPEGSAYFSVYEKAKTGKGEVLTGRDSFQANRRLKDYVEEIQESFDDVTVKGGVITARGPKSVGPNQVSANVSLEAREANLARFMEGSKTPVLYHGTNVRTDFDTFTTERANWFTTNPDEAFEYAPAMRNKKGTAQETYPKKSRGIQPARTIPAHVSIKNPATLDDPKIQKLLKETQPDWPAGERYGFGGHDVSNNFKAVKEVLEKEGYDGIKWLHPKSFNMHYAPLNPGQIKSASGNIGTFNPDNPNMLKAALPLGGAGLLHSLTEEY